MLSKLLLVWTWLFVRLAGWMIVLHLIEITVWALFYEWQGAIPDLQSALYFSTVTYTTTGYGDVLLPREWRLEGGVEALTGILSGPLQQPSLMSLAGLICHPCNRQSKGRTGPGTKDQGRR